MYIIAGGILVVIAVVFLAPKKKKATIAEEKTAISLDEIDAIILKEYGADLTPENKEIVREAIAEELARDKAEMRKYGRLLTDEERSEQWWREQDEAEEKAAYAQLYEERKDWIDNFPFRPGYHADIVFDPENNIAHSPEKMQAYRKELEKKVKEAKARYDAKDEECWKYQNDPELRYKLREERHNLWIAMEEARKLDPEIKEQQRILYRHKQLAGFYAQEYRYRPEFEQAYRIFEEEGAGDNPLRIANTMIPLESYKVASQHDPEELHPFQTRIERQPHQHSQLTNPQNRRPDRKTYRRRITWGEELETAYGCIIGNMMSQRNLIPGEENISREKADQIAKRLVEEIPADGFTGNTFLVGLADPKDHELVPGQSLLVE